MISDLVNCRVVSYHSCLNMLQELVNVAYESNVLQVYKINVPIYHIYVMHTYTYILNRQEQMLMYIVYYVVCHTWVKSLSQKMPANWN